MATKSAHKARRKFKFERRVGRAIMNPVVAALDRVGIRSSLVVELETTGAKSGEPRRVPLAGRTDGNAYGSSRNTAAAPAGPTTSPPTQMCASG